MRAIAIAAASALALPCASCTTPALSATNVPIARGVEFDLLPPSGLGTAISLEQLVDARYGERSFSFHCLLEVDASELVLVALTPFGTRAFALTLRDGKLELEADSLREIPAEPARILADLQIALWEHPVVDALDVIERTAPSGERVREISRRGEPVIRVTYSNAVRWKDRLRFEHLEQGYVLDVRTVRAEPLAP
jgi:hypothetical protein